MKKPEDWEKEFNKIRLTKCPLKGGCQDCKAMKSFIKESLAKALSKQKQEIIEKIYKTYDCNGPTDEIHRCSYAHCKRCGKCDDISEILTNLGEI